MSYDMNIGDEEFNYTYNVSPMWYAANEEKGIRAHYGLTGIEAIHPLRDIRDYMEAHYSELLAMNPANGWGDYFGALGFVNKLIHASIRNPGKTWAGD